MNHIRKWLFGNEKYAMRNSYIWDFAYSIEYSLQSAILMLIITRISGPYESGIFLIAYTVTQLTTAIGNYGLRSFQVSDVRKEYSFRTYFASRIVTIVLMIIATALYSASQGYDRKRIILIIILCAYRIVECVEDVFHAEMQKKMRLDIASKIAAIKIFVSTIAFAVVFYMSKSLVLASIVLLMVAVVISLLLTMVASGEFEEISLKAEWNNIPKLLWVCLPVCAGAFLYNYLVNAPKYAIDRNLSEEMQTIFNILFMPIFAINMLSVFIFKPLIAKMGVMWNEKNKKTFVLYMFRQILVIIGITIAVVIGGVLIGLDVLGWMYGVVLSEYRLLFACLLIFGGFAALVSYLVVLLTIVRKQSSIMVAYGIAMILDIIFIDGLVVRYGIWGAGMSYGLSMGIVLIILTSVLVATVIGGKRFRTKTLKERRENE